MLLGSMPLEQLHFQNCSKHCLCFGNQFAHHSTLDQHLHYIEHSSWEGVLEAAIYLETGRAGCYFEFIAASIAATFTTDKQQLAYVANSLAGVGCYQLMGVEQEEVDIAMACSKFVAAEVGSNT